MSISTIHVSPSSAWLAVLPNVRHIRQCRPFTHITAMADIVAAEVSVGGALGVVMAGQQRRDLRGQLRAVFPRGQPWSRFKIPLRGRL